MVEDNRADVGLVRETLDEHAVRCELIVINNGESAIELIQTADADQTRCPDLVILDLRLPKRPGKEVLQHLRSSPKCGQVPVIVLTSSDNTKDRVEALSLGAAQFLRKPSNFSEFLQLGAIFKQTLSGFKPPHTD